MPTDLSPEEITRSHKWHAIESNNLAWNLADRPARTAAEDEEMLHAAHASAFHWAKAGTVLNQARANMLLAHVHAALRDGRAALAYAEQCNDYLAAHDPPDWEMAFSQAVLAHAAYAAGEADLHREYHARAQQLGQAIADPEDKEIFLRTFNLIPSP